MYLYQHCCKSVRVPTHGSRQAERRALTKPHTMFSSGGACSVLYVDIRQNLVNARGFAQRTIVAEPVVFTWKILFFRKNRYAY
jgi:hypothetical protein